MKTRVGHVLACAAAAAMVALALPALAGAPAPTPVDGTATLTMTFEVKGGGVDRPESRERNDTWTVADRYTLTATMSAQKPGGFGTFLKPDADEQAREAERAAAAGAAAGNMQSLMEQSQKIAEMCGDDEACAQAEIMKMAQGIDMNSPEMQEAQSNVAAASVMPEARYQLFVPVTQSATYDVDEVAHEAHYDAACTPATEASCAIDTAVGGKGDFTDESGATVGPTAASAEIDYQTGSLLVVLTAPGFATVTKTVTSRNPEAEAGTTDAIRTVGVADVAGSSVTVSCGACVTASGSFEKDVTDDLLGRPAKLVVTWSFERS